MIRPTIVQLNVGIDIAKANFKVALVEQQNTGHKRVLSSKTFKNNKSGFDKFLNWLAQKSPKDVVPSVTLEATGVYYEQLVHFLDEQSDLTIHVVLPNMAKAYIKSLNQSSKTDKLDARALGYMGIERELRVWQPLSDNLFTLKQLTRDRCSLLAEQTALKNKLEALNNAYTPNKNAIKRIKSRLQLIAKQLKSVKKEIQQCVKEDEVLMERLDKVLTIKGVALMTAATIIAETNGFEHFTSRAQLTSYAGYDVVHRESGTSLKGKTYISKKGNKYIRRALHFPAITAVKYTEEFKQLFDRILARTAIKMKAYVAVQRKLLLLIYTLFKNNVAYDPSFHQKLVAQK